MRYLGSARVAVTVMVASAGLCGLASSSSAEAVEGNYGTIDAVDPLVGFDWAPALDAPDVAAEAAAGATVTDAPCTFGDRPGGVLAPQIFRRPIRTTGHLVVTPSGNISFVCHAAASAASFQRPLPTQAIVVDRAPCFLPSGRRTNDSHLVVTPSLQVHLVCHVDPAP